MGSQISADPCLIFRAFGGILSLTIFPWCLKLQLLLQGQCLAPQLSGQQSVLWGGRTKIEWGEGGRRNPKYSITQTRTLLNLPCSCAPQICPLIFPLFTLPTYSPCHSLVLTSIIFTPTTTIFPLKTLYLLHNMPYLPPLPLHKFAHHPIFVPLIIHLPIHFTSVSKVPILILTPTAPIFGTHTPYLPLDTLYLTLLPQICPSPSRACRSCSFLSCCRLSRSSCARRCRYSRRSRAWRRS